METDRGRDELVWRGLRDLLTGSGTGLNIVAMVVLLATSLVVGVLIGTVGVGGVLLAPILITVGGMEPHQATATALCCVVPTGIASAVTHRRVGLRQGSLGRRLAVGLIAGSVAGAWLNGFAPATVLTVMLAGVAIVSGLWLLVDSVKVDGEQCGRQTLGTGFGLAMGGIVGCGSAVTGTSGPALLVPALIAARIPADSAVAVSQLSQALVAPAGAVAYLSTVDLDLFLVANLSIVITLGYWAGTKASRLLPGMRQQSLVALVLLATGALMLIRQLYS